MPNLYLRVLSSLVLAPIVLGAAYVGGSVYTSLILIAACVASYEWGKLLGASLLSRSFIVLGSVTLSAVPIFFPQWEWDFLLGMTALLVLAGIVIVAGLRRDRRVLAAWIGIFYLVPAFIALQWLRTGIGAGIWPLLFIVLVVWATDIGAYVCGRAIGGEKLAPSISPKKTWAGFFGGIVSAIVVSVILVRFLTDSDSDGLLASVVWGVGGGLLSIVSQAGDLFESWVKRRVGAKDSGILIPGHGGILDRIDGLMFAAPAGALLLFVTRFLG